MSEISFKKFLKYIILFSRFRFWMPSSSSTHWQPREDGLLYAILLHAVVGLERHRGRRRHHRTSGLYFYQFLRQMSFEKARPFYQLKSSCRYISKMDKFWMSDKKSSHDTEALRPNLTHFCASALPMVKVSPNLRPSSH